jgi:hypothetical protein
MNQFVVTILTEMFRTLQPEATANSCLQSGALANGIKVASYSAHSPTMLSSLSMLNNPHVTKLTAAKRTTRQYFNFFTICYYRRIVPVNTPEVCLPRAQIYTQTNRVMSTL